MIILDFPLAVFPKASGSPYISIFIRKSELRSRNWALQLWISLNSIISIFGDPLCRESRLSNTFGTTSIPFATVTLSDQFKVRSHVSSKAQRRAQGRRCAVLSGPGKEQKKSGWRPTANLLYM